MATFVVFTPASPILFPALSVSGEVLEMVLVQVGVGGKVRGGQRWGVFRKMLMGKQNEGKMYHVDVCLRQAATDASTIQY
jgi:hypothetical protein